MKHFTKTFTFILILLFSIVTQLHANSDLFNCSDGIMNGQETGVDCGGPVCPPCSCTDNKILLDNYTTDDIFMRSASEWIFLDKNVMLESNSKIIFKAEKFINIDQEFEIELGSETLLTIEDCVEPTSYPPGDASLLLLNDCGVELEPCDSGSDICDSNRPDITLRLNLFSIRDNNGFGGLDANDVNIEIAKMRDTYDPHRIYFVVCIEEIRSTQILDEGPRSDNIEYLYLNFSKSDAINGFLFPYDPLASRIGQADGIPSNSFWSMDWFYTLSHELGHCLGLCHTFRGYRVGITCPTDKCDQERVTRPNDCQGNCDQIDCNRQACIPNCNITGDYVCDTPPDLGTCEQFTNDNQMLNYPGWTDYCGVSYTTNNIIPTNVMSYWAAGRFLTEGQACKAYTTILEFHQDKIVDPIAPIVVNNDLVINGNVTLNTNHIFNADIIIQPGASLTFDGIRAEFSKTSQIITNTLVFGSGYTYTKASITIIDSQLSATCGAESWEGFDLEEGTDLSITNSQIRNAEKIDASFNSFVVDDNIPGQYIISGSLFEDSPLFLNEIDGLVDINGSTFIRNRFSGNSLVRIYGDVMPNDAFINNCSFINNESQLVPSADALEIIDVGFVCLNSKFENFDRAIHAYTVLRAPDGALVQGCTFTDNFTSIEASVYSGFKIKSNIVEVGQGHDNYSQDHTGVYLNYCIDYVIENNEFKTGTIGTAVLKGLTVKNGGPDFEQVVSNDFNNLDEAIIALGNNRDLPLDGIVGLEFRCNNLSSIDDTDIQIAGDGVQKRQGDGVNGAGNNFSYSNIFDSESSIRMLTSTDMDYFRANNESANNPNYVDPSKVDVFAADKTPQCFDSNFRLVQEKNSTAKTLGNLIDSYLFHKDQIVYGRYSTDEMAYILRSINLNIKSIINSSSFESFKAEMNEYWTRYKTSDVAQRKAFIDKINNEESKVKSIINDINQLSAQRYSSEFKMSSFIAVLQGRINASNSFEAELYKNLLQSIE